MSAELLLLRKAAVEIRLDFPEGGPQRLNAAFRATADWLDTAGADLWAHGPLCECGNGCHACDDDPWQPHVRRALAVARAYLSADSG